MTDINNDKPLINIVTLGCAKNIVDSEYLMRQLKEGGYTTVHNSDEDKAKTVIVNTCGFINDAKEESINTILQFAHAKEKGVIKQLFVMGCLSERYRNELRKKIPEIDRLFGVDEHKNILQELDTIYRYTIADERILTTPSHYAYLKISEGCDRTCAFCIIPQIRGSYHSRSSDEILSETKKLVQKGVKEIILIAQDLAFYGIDNYKTRYLTRLVEKIAGINGIEWLRLHYLYPSGFPRDLISLVKNTPNICNYLDIPFQHISNKLLRMMRRGHDKKEILDLIGFIRREIPDIALRTTLLVGHPGENKEEFNELTAFIKEAQFERLGVFAYSHEEDTYSWNHYKNHVSEKEKQMRVSEIMEIQQGISRKQNQEKKGKILKVLIDRKEDEYYVGRTEHDSPEIDNEVLVKHPSKTIQIGEFYNVKITSSNEYDLFGELA